MERPRIGSIRVGRGQVGPSAGQRFLPRTSNRWAVHSEPPRSIVAELPCQPQVQVIVCAWCLYSSITCLNGSTVGDGGLERAGDCSTRDSCTATARCRVRTGSRLQDILAGSARSLRANGRPGRRPITGPSIGPEVVPEPPRQPADLAQHRRPGSSPRSSMASRRTSASRISRAPTYRAGSGGNARGRAAGGAAAAARAGIVGPLQAARAARIRPPTTGRPDAVAAVAVAVVDRPARARDPNQGRWSALMSIGPPQASSMRDVARSTGTGAASPAARGGRRPSVVRERGPDPPTEPGPAAAATDGDPAVGRRAQVVEREARIGDALAAGPADLGESVRGSARSGRCTTTTSRAGGPNDGHAAAQALSATTAAPARTSPIARPPRS